MFDHNKNAKNGIYNSKLHSNVFHTVETQLYTDTWLYENQNHISQEKKTNTYFSQIHGYTWRHFVYTNNQTNNYFS